MAAWADTWLYASQVQLQMSQEALRRCEDRLRTALRDTEGRSRRAVCFHSAPLPPV